MRARPASNEHALKGQCDTFFRGLKSRGEPFWYVKIHGGGYQRAHLPDYILIVRGRVLALELKSPKENPVASPGQNIELQWMRRAGADTLVSNDLDEIKERIHLMLDAS